MIRRKIKNVVKNYTEVEILVREATSNETWGPSNSILVKIAVLSSVDANIIQIMPIIWKRLKDTGKKWRHVYKSLILLEFLITRGNPAVSDNCRLNIHFLQTLESFQYEENNIDVGSRIRKRAETLVQLLKDNDLLKSERNKAAITDMRFSKAIISQGSNVPIKYGNGVGSLSQGPSTGSFSSNTENNKEYNKSDYVVPTSLQEEDMQLQIALAESQEDANQKKQLEEIEKLTDNYKLSLAVEKNLKDNEFQSNFESDTKLDGWVNEPKKNLNDPWFPVDESKKIEENLSFPIVNNPWSSIDASNDSLWSNSNKVEFIDPWHVPQATDDGMWPLNVDTSVENPWPVVSTESIESSDPWNDISKMSTSISHNAITGEIEYNPWASHAVSSNPIPRKFTSHNKSDSVTNFLADHSHLVNFENLISMESLKPTTDSYNPFHEPATQSCNPFLPLSARHVNNYPAQVDWTSLEGVRNSSPTQVEPSKHKFSNDLNNPRNQNQLNPFLT